jgi:hypothetical protein
MAPNRPSLKCLFVAWIFGWVVAIYLPSALVALADLSPLAEGRSLPAATFAVADEVAPAAKIGFALLLGLLAIAVRRLSLRRPLEFAADVAAACLAMFLMLALLPREWSRGFGIGLTGERFQSEALAIYLVGAVFSGLVFSISHRRCQRRNRPQTAES